MRIKRMSTNNYKKGFTLVEMLVASAIFVVVMVAAVGALVTIINADNKAQSIKTVIDNVTSAVDDMARDIRSGTNYGCLYPPNPGGNNSNSQWDTNPSDCAGGSNAVEYSPNGNANETIYYQFTTNPAPGSGGGNIQEECPTQNCPNIPNTWQSITAPISVTNITNMTFYVTPGDATDQPRVLITATGLIPSKNGASTEFDLQTTASQRSRN